jgi:hypothetical protein
MAGGGLVGVLASFALASATGSSEPKLMVLILLSWVFFAVGLYGLVVGERAERGFFRALRLVFVPVFAFVGTFATFMLATKR